MKNNSINPKEEFISLFYLYLSKWKFFIVSIILFLAIAFIYLRYSNKTYNTTATIKIKDNQQKNNISELPSLQSFGMFSGNFGKVNDEIQVLKSKTLIEQSVKDLNLNIEFFNQGRIKETENYTIPPLNLTFFKNDSIINKVDTTFYISILSDTKFQILDENHDQVVSDTNKKSSSIFNFGDKIDNSFGGIIITPNSESDILKKNTTIKIKFTPLHRVVKNYQEKLGISNADGSNILFLSMSGTMKRKSEDFLNKLIEKYNEDVVNDKEEEIKVTSEFITNRLDVVADELEKVDLTAETLKKDNRLSDISSQSSIFLQSEKENENNLIATTNQIQLIEYMQDHLNSNNDNGDLLPINVGIEDPGIIQVTRSHNDLVLQRNRILKNSSDKNPTVINLNSQIRALKDNLKQSLTNLKSSSQITLNSLKKTDSRINAEIYSTPTKERKFRDITRQQSIKESLYLYLLQKREETAITLGMSSPNAKIIDQAYTSPLPISPKPLFIYLAAGILGLFLPISLIYFKEFLDNKVHTKKDLTNNLSIPYIGEIPKSPLKDVPVKKVDYSPKAESFRILRTNIDFMLQNINHKSKIVFVTSTTSQEGKSHTSVNLALSLAHSEKSVLLIETDIRVPRASKYLEVENKIGLTDFISNKKLKIEDVLVKSNDSTNLQVIPSGTIPPNPAELLLSDRVAELFETVNNQFDYIIVDTAAVGLVTDTLLISKYADLFIYVVKANYLDKRNLHIAQTMYDEKRLPNMTILLNNADQKKSYGYGYGYGYGKNPNKLGKWWHKYLSKKL